MTKIALFWHIGIFNNNIEKALNIIQRQYKKIEDSGILLDSTIYIGLINNNSDENSMAIDFINNIVNSNPNINLLFIKNEGHEGQTLGELYDWCLKNPEGYVCYIHSKGSSHQEYNKNIDDWTEYLEWCVIEKYNDSVKLLDQGYNTVGCNYSKEVTKHYSGNFWWASSRWINTLKNPKNIKDRHWASEFWIIHDAKDLKKHHSFHNSNINHYFHPYPSSSYRK